MPTLRHLEHSVFTHYTRREAAAPHLHESACPTIADIPIYQCQNSKIQRDHQFEVKGALVLQIHGPLELALAL